MYWNRSLVSVATLLLLLTSASGFTTPAALTKSSISQSKVYRPAIFVSAKRNGYDKSPSRRRKIWRASKKSLAALTVAWSLTRGPPAAHAKPPPVIQSIKPGLAGAELDAALDPDVVIFDESKDQIVVHNTAEEKPTKKREKVKTKTKTKPKSKNLYNDDEEDDDDDIDFEELSARKRTKEATAAESASSEGKNNVGMVLQKEYSSLEFMKAFAFVAAIPVTFFCSIETYRRVHEKSYVEKALKIQELKKAEYANKLKAEEEKRLAEMKGNETNVDDDEEDDGEDDGEDDDDDDDDDSPKPPKTPPPSGGGDDGDSPPSQDEIDRLNKLMGR